MKPRDLDSDVEVTFDDAVLGRVVGLPFGRVGERQGVRLSADVDIPTGKMRSGSELWLHWCQIRRYRLRGGDWLESAT